MSIVRLIINAVALLAAALLVPGLRIRWGDDTIAATLALVVLALVFAFINSFVRPVIRLMALPLNLVTLGFFSFLVNAAMLLLLAGLVDAIWRPVLVVGGFPPALSLDAVAAAMLGSFVISLVSTLLAVLAPEV